MHAEREARSVQRVSVRIRVFTVCTYVYTVSTVFSEYTIVYTVYIVFTVFIVYTIVYSVYTVYTVYTLFNVFIKYEYRISEFVARGSVKQMSVRLRVFTVFTVYSYVYTVFI